MQDAATGKWGQDIGNVISGTWGSDVGEAGTRYCKSGLMGNLVMFRPFGYNIVRCHFQAFSALMMYKAIYHSFLLKVNVSSNILY